MTFNTSKCVVLHLGRNNSKYEYVMGDTKLHTVHEKGVLITSDLKPTRQCQQADAKANKALGLSARTITYKRPKVLLQLYKTLT